MKRTFLYWVFLLVFLLGVAVASIPYFLSSTWGKPWLIAVFERKLRSKISMDRVSLSWFGPQRFSHIEFSNPDMQGTVEELSSPVPLWRLNAMERAFTLQNGIFRFSAADEVALTVAHANVIGRFVDITGATSKGGSLKVQGTIHSENEFNVTADLKEFPVVAIDHLTNLSYPLLPLLGPWLHHVTASFAYNHGKGSLQCDFSSSYLKTQVHAALFEDHIELQESLLAMLHISPELLASHSKAFLSHLESKTPAILRIPAKSFSLPIRPFTLQKLQILGATLDLGQLTAEGGSSFLKLLRLLKAETQGNHIDIWCAPFAFHMEKGMLHLGRLDALFASSLHLCTWGNIDLLQERLNLYLGIPADTLERAFKLQKLPRNYVLKVPIRGTLQSPDINTSGASSKIATMVAVQNAPRPSGTAGQIFGGLLDFVTQPKEEDPDVPPPNRPFPWEQQ